MRLLGINKMYIQGYVRIFLNITAQMTWQMMQANMMTGANFQFALYLTLFMAQGIMNITAFIQPVFYFRQQGVCRVGGLYATSGRFKQLDPKVFFETVNTFGDSRLGNEELICGQRNRTGFHDFHESFKGCEIHLNHL